MKKINLLLCIVVFLNFSIAFANVFGKNENRISIIENEPEAVVVKTTKDSYKVNEPITVTFSGLPGDKKDWITLIKPSASVRDYGNWKYTNGKTSGSLTFDGMRAGDYEVRVFFSNGFTVQARYPFKVSKNADEASLDDASEESPAKNYINSTIQKLDEVEKLKNNPDWNNDRFISKYHSWLQGATVGISDIKSKDPNFDVSSLQKRADDYQALYEKSTAPSEGELAEADFKKMINDKSWKLNYLIDDKLGSGAGWVHSYFNTANYFKKAEEADYPQLLKITQEGTAKFKGYNMDYNVTTIKEFGAKYKTYYDGTLDKVINGLIESAYENKTKNAQEALKYAEQAKQLSDAALLILPNNAQVKALNKDATATYEKVGGAVFAKVYTSDFHKKNAGKVVFFTKKPTIKAENSSTVKADYKAGEYIYAMAYLKGSFKDLTKASNNINVTTKIFVDGTEKASHEFRMDWTSLKENKAYLFMEIVPDPVTNKHSGPAKFAKALANISPRNHTIKVTLSGLQVGSSYVIDLAEGEFKLDCSTGQDKLAAYAVKYREKSLSDVYMPKAKLNNTTLANSMKKALQDEGWEKDKKVQRVVITGSGWKITKHQVTGKILYRSIPAAVAFKTSEGYCKYWNLNFKQHYNGTNYGKTVQGGVGSIVDMSCKNVFK
ncbi:MAG: hypothetical protein DRI95_00970 [Bacteroidetes bacterium]|nr:MAG: hypothetical protein DRI95_00970 [Bacteroidota bacterium]